MRVIATVNQRDIYNSLPRNARIKDVEQQILDGMKREFERQGILFLDKPGLYPEYPNTFTKERIGNWLEITIKQGKA